MGAAPLANSIHPAFRFPRPRIGLTLGAALTLFVALRVVWCLLQPIGVYNNEEYIQLRLAAVVWGEDSAWEGWPYDPATVASLDPARPLSLFDFLYHPFEGSTLVLSILLVPVAGVLGLGAASIKTVAIGWSVGVAAAWIVLLRRLWGDDAVVPAACVFACAPMPWVYSTLLLHGYHHSQVALFLPLALLLLVGVLDDRAAKARWSALGAGGLMGFGVWFSVLNLLPAALVGVLLLLLPGGIRRFPLYVLGGVVGLAPWLGSNDLGGVSSFGASHMSLGEVLATVSDRKSRPHLMPLPGTLLYRPTFTAIIDALWQPEGERSPVVEVATRALIVLGAGVAAARALRDRAEPMARMRLVAVLAAAGTVVGMVLALSAPGIADFEQRRISGAFPAAIVLLAMGQASLAQGSRPRQIGAFALGALLTAHLSITAGAAFVDRRPDEPFASWVMASRWTPDLRDRVQVGIGSAQIEQAQVGALQGAFRRLVVDSPDRGSTELFGLSVAMAAGAAACVSSGSESAEFVTNPREALGYGAGLSLVCPRAEVALGVCGGMPESLRELCVEGTRRGTNPRSPTE